MIRIAITNAAYAVIADALPGEPASRGKTIIWLDGPLADAIGALRRRGENYSDVILRLAGTEARTLN